MDLDTEQRHFILAQERERLWAGIRKHAYGDMGPAAVKLRDIEYLFRPEAPVD